MMNYSILSSIKRQHLGILHHLMCKSNEFHEEFKKIPGFNRKNNAFYTVGNNCTYYEYIYTKTAGVTVPFHGFVFCLILFCVHLCISIYRVPMRMRNRVLPLPVWTALWNPGIAPDPVWSPTEVTDSM